MSNMVPALEHKEGSYKEPVGRMKQVGNNHLGNHINGESNHVKKTSEKKVEMKDVEVIMVEGENSGNSNGVAEDKYDADLTESSSSFDSDGTSFTEEDDLDDASSEFPFDGYSDLFHFKKKKLKSAWKKDVGPLRWRCKWLELQMRKFESQARKYDRESAELERREQLENSKPEYVNSEAFPNPAQSSKRVYMRRKKRRRAEDSEDISAYMSQHNLFSYFEKKKLTADAGVMNGNSGNQGAGAENPYNGTAANGFNEELISREFIEGGNLLERIFWNIGMNQWKLRDMKTRARKVLSENVSRVSSNENLSNYSLARSAENPASPVKNEERFVAVTSTVSSEKVGLDSDTKMVDVAIPESAALSLGEVNRVQASISISPQSRNPTGTILMYNRRAKMKPKEVKLEGSTEDPHQASSSNFSHHQVPEPATPNKMCSISKMQLTNPTGTSTTLKRKRAMRKAGSGKWSQ